MADFLGGYLACSALEVVAMSSFWDKLLGRQPASASQAKERLKLVLIHDRTDLTPAAIDALKDDLIAVISRYVEIDPNAVHIAMTQDGREQRLIADIPLRPSRRRGLG
jgi:cell division topological specificity factor